MEWFTLEEEMENRFAEPSPGETSKPTLVPPPASTALRKPPRNLRKIADPLALDWSKRDIQLAEEIGISRQRLSIIRKRLKIPPPASVNTAIPRVADGRRAKVVKFKDYLCGKTWGQIEEFLGFPVASRPLQRFIRKIVRVERARHVFYHLCNWQLHNKDIAVIWGVKEEMVKEWRAHHKVHPQMYWPLGPENKLIKTEREKALKFKSRKIKDDKRKAPPKPWPPL